MAEVKILNNEGSALSSILSSLRDKEKQQDASMFRHNLKKIGLLMAYEISKSFDYEIENIETLLGTAKEWQSKEKLVLCHIFQLQLKIQDVFLLQYLYESSA